MQKLENPIEQFHEGRPRSKRMGWWRVEHNLALASGSPTTWKASPSAHDIFGMTLTLGHFHIGQFERDAEIVYDDDNIDHVHKIQQLFHNLDRRGVKVEVVRHQPRDKEYLCLPRQLGLPYYNSGDRVSSAASLPDRLPQGYDGQDSQPSQQLVELLFRVGQEIGRRFRPVEPERVSDPLKEMVAGVAKLFGVVAEEPWAKAILTALKGVGKKVKEAAEEEEEEDGDSFVASVKNHIASSRGLKEIEAVEAYLKEERSRREKTEQETVKS